MKQLLFVALSSALLATTAPAQIIVHTGDDLAAIVASAPSGSVIEIQSDAVFASDLSITAKSLTLRAGTGFTPELAGVSGPAVAMGYGDATLILKGLTLRAGGSTAVSAAGNTLLTTSDTLRIANCSLIGNLSLTGPGSSAVLLSTKNTDIAGAVTLNIDDSRQLQLAVDSTTASGQLVMYTTISAEFHGAVTDSTFGGLDGLIGAGAFNPLTTVAFTGSWFTAPVDIQGTQKSSDWTFTRCTFYDTFRLTSVGSFGDHHALLENCLHTRTVQPPVGRGIQNYTFAGAGVAHIEAVGCTITGFVAGVNLIGGATLKNGLVYGNIKDVETGGLSPTPSSAILNSWVEDGTFAGLNGNFAGPVAVDGSFALLPGSIGIDAGDNSLATASALDLYGHPRLVDEDGDGVATINVGAVEQPPSLYAAASVFNGTGINPIEFSSNLPVIGTLFKATVATSPTAILTVMAIDMPGATPLIIPGWTGELLIAALPTMVLDFGTGNHFVPIPLDPALIGAILSAQGARVELNGPILDVILLHRLDLRLGL
jgi:hypothetical protein